MISSYIASLLVFVFLIERKKKGLIQSPSAASRSYMRKFSKDHQSLHSIFAWAAPRKPRNIVTRAEHNMRQAQINVIAKGCGFKTYSIEYQIFRLSPVFQNDLRHRLACQITEGRLKFLCSKSSFLTWKSLISKELTSWSTLLQCYCAWSLCVVSAMT